MNDLKKLSSACWSRRPTRAEKFINFDADGNYTGTSHDTWWHNLWHGSKGRIMDASGEETRRFKFADPKNDVEQIQNGTIKKLVIVDEKDIKTMMSNSGAFSPENQTKNKGWSKEEHYGYILQEGVGGGKLDFSYTAIPNMYPGASRDPLNTPSPMIFLIDDMAHNHMNFGNYLFGAAGHALGYKLLTLKLGAHYNSLDLNNSGKNGYKPQLDSHDDQVSIEKGYRHAEENNYRDELPVGTTPPPTETDKR